MALVSPDRLAAACHEADPETVTAFVADLYAARGYDVDRLGDQLVRLEPGGRRLAVRPAGGTVPDDADAIVTADADRLRGDATGIDADELATQLAYAIDRDRARELLSTHFGICPNAGAMAGSDPHSADDETLQGQSGSDGRWGTRDVPVPWRVHRGTVTLVVASVVVLSVALAASGLAQFPGSESEPDDPAVATPAPTATPANGSLASDVSTTQTPAPATESTTDATLDSESLPSGIGPDGITDVDALAAAHQTHLLNTSHTVIIQHREYGIEGERVTGVYTETIRVESERRYRVDVSTVGNLTTTPRAVAGADLFVTGDERYVDESTHSPYFRNQATPARFRWQLVRYLRWSLSVKRSTVYDDMAADTIRVTTDGDPYPGVENASGTVYVTDDGLIPYARWTYTLPSASDRRVEFVVRTTNVGTTSVSRPQWATVNGTGTPENGTTSDGDNN